MPGVFGFPETRAAAAGLNKCWWQSMTGAWGDCVAPWIERITSIVQRANRMISNATYQARLVDSRISPPLVNPP